MEIVESALTNRPLNILVAAENLTACRFFLSRQVTGNMAGGFSRNPAAKSGSFFY
jgi:hypothetical protein